MYAIPSLEGTGLEVIDLRLSSDFAARRLHTRDMSAQMEGMRRLTHAFVSAPDTILQELVNAAVDLCGADSAGISVEKEDRTNTEYWEWVATAGQYSGFLNATLPRFPSACGICLERDYPQLFRVDQRFFDLMGVVAPTVMDGILLPWHADEVRGTIWIMAHNRSQAFDQEDLRMMQVLADFAAMGIRHKRQQDSLMNRATAAAAAAMANDLAHQINNPLQSLTNVVYLAENGGDTRSLVHDLSDDLKRLSSLVKKLLSLPGTKSQSS